MRLTGLSVPLFTDYDDILGRRYVPGIEGYYRREGEAYVKINKNGFRDVEHKKLKPQDTVRIAVLGDSFTSALQVPLNSTYCRLLEGNLESCLSAQPKNVEVMNFGVDGYNTAQELVLFKTDVRYYEPDIVIVSFFPGNDIHDNNRTLASDRMRPFFDLRGHDLIVDMSFREGPEFLERKTRLNSLHRYLYRRVRTLQFMHFVKKSLENNMNHFAYQKKQYRLTVPLEIYMEPRDEE
ncbi:SGNH/GDSL hydrolase family protein [Thermodesulfobacteriota bacterium]